MNEKKPAPLRMQDDSDPTREITSAEIRAAMPLCTAHGDWVREDFKSIVGIRASENGHSIKWGELIEGEGVEVQVPEKKQKRFVHMAGGSK